ncbi:hypothetical protein DEMA109039_08285 [Deinococcus marmoris]
MLKTSLARYPELWLRHKDELKNSAIDLQIRLNLIPKKFAAFGGAQISSYEVASGLGKSAVAGAGAGAAALGAAKSGLLVWFGGGMTLGDTVLGGIFVTPAVLMGAFAAACKGEQRLTQV